MSCEAFSGLLTESRKWFEITPGFVRVSDLVLISDFRRADRGPQYLILTLNPPPLSL